MKTMKISKTNTFDHPAYYNQPDRKECIDEMVDKFGLIPVISWAILTIYKYMYRAGNKPNVSEDEDFNKAKWYWMWAYETYKKNADTIDISNLCVKYLVEGMGDSLKDVGLDWPYLD